MKFILILLLAFLTSCTITPIDTEEKIYTIQIVCANGDETTIYYEGVGENYFSIDKSDLKVGPGCSSCGKTIYSSIRTFKITSITNKKTGKYINIKKP